MDGTIDGKLLHNDLDDNPNPGHISWRYTPPAEGAPGTTPILVQPYQVTVGGQTAPGQIVITLDGKMVSGSKSVNGNPINDRSGKSMTGQEINDRSGKSMTGQGNQ